MTDGAGSGAERTDGGVDLRRSDGEDAEPGPSDTMRGRVPGSRLRLWLLLGASRSHIAALLLGAVFAVLVVLGEVDPVGLRTAVSTGDPIETAFQALLTAIITGVTLVVTINQLVLSQELGAVGDQRERMREATSFRQDVEAMLDEPVSPAEPAAFLGALVGETADRADDLADAVESTADETARERVTDYAQALTENAGMVREDLESAEFGTFDVLFSVLNFNYSWKIYEARRLRAVHEDDLDDATLDALDDVVDVLEQFGPAREHFKTLYFQWELIDLSRSMLYAAVPALVTATAMLLYVSDPGTVVGATLGVDNLVWVTAAAVAVSLVPFALLVAYVLRIATVAQRTLSIGPFILRETDRTDDVDWEA